MNAPLKFRIIYLKNKFKDFYEKSLSKNHYKKQRKKSINQLRKINNNVIANNSNEIRLFAIMRNESLRLPHFLNYYKNFGVDRFFLIDNNSNDDTLEILKANENIYLFSTTENYKNHWFWMEHLIETYGKNHWCVVVDIDELFSFPNSETLTLKVLANYLENEKSTAFGSLLLDMYSNNDIGKIEYKKGNNPMDVIPYFDSSYELSTFSFLDRITFKYFSSKIFVGGMRKRVFGEISPPHILSKISFFKNIEGTYLVQGMHAIYGAKLSDIQGIVFHTKFLNDFIDEVKEETKRGEHYGGAFYYKHYEKRINQNTNLNFYHENSVKYIDSRQLVDLGLMKSNAQFETFCQNIQKENT